MEDHYAVLGVPRTASISIIRESYRRLALRFHPDKNKNSNATSEFQRIVRAWEVLQDEEKRANYDGGFGWSSNRSSEQNYDEFLRSWKSREDANPEPKNWSYAGEDGLHNDRLLRREKSRAWKELVKQEYLSRLETWASTRKRLVPLVLACRDSIALRESQFNVLSNMGNCEAIIQFQKAVELSKSTGTVVEDSALIISKLVSAREKFMARLSHELSDVKIQRDQLLLQLEENQRTFEYQEIDSQQLHVQEALQILGPRDLSASLLIDVDPRLRAINRWESLAKIGSPRNFSSPSVDLSEGPWHSQLEWERMTGELKCSRCDKLDFHVIPECGPARCPTCGVVVCNECHRDLWLLRQYDEWIMSSVDGDEECFFNLDV
ncbi:Chaperone J-domain-containing protein [Glarea lozoyensis ATCC 20868]|uniref:Chaperone J-domain-containing protein n=1 Tax=Glarea lozoyensis (strain ATCC 20868 / MF5171) TaxID=1116229 RepID=S3DNS8_GLAL2|nr:Chaperone J-domain-containing protein [Glarea lozoyensis ATCC 20868]EPE28133.1 Chaperone J-domain-containing protein [Glarea lozoyensis ATCC 20868]